MKVILPKKEFLGVLAKVNPTVSASKMVPIYQCYCFRDGMISTYNGNSGTTTPSPLKEADFCVQANRFFKIIQYCDSEIELDFEANGKKLIIKSNKYKAELGTHVNRSFPEIVPGKMEHYSDADNFVVGLNAIAFSACLNPMKENLFGVTVCNHHLYSSDGIRISRYALNKPVNRPIVFPMFAVEQLIKMGQPDHLFTTGNMVGALWKDSQTIYVSNTMVYKFPVNMVDDMLDKNPTLTVEFPEEFLSAIARVKLLAPSEETHIVVSYEDKTLTVKALTSDVGEAIEEISWECDYDFRFAIKPDFLEDGIKKTRRVDLGDILFGEARMIRFVEGKFDSLSGLTSE